MLVHLSLQLSYSQHIVFLVRRRLRLKRLFQFLPSCQLDFLIEVNEALKLLSSIRVVFSRNLRIGISVAHEIVLLIIIGQCAVVVSNLGFLLKRFLRMKEKGLVGSVLVVNSLVLVVILVWVL